MSQEENIHLVKETNKWLEENVKEPESTTVSQACFVLQGGIMIMCAQHVIEMTLETSVCYGDMVSNFVERLNEASQILSNKDNP